MLSVLLGIMFAVYAFRDYFDTHALDLATRQDGALAQFFFSFFGLT